MNKSEKLRIGIIGLGHWGPNIVRSLSTHPRCEIRYVCDILDSNIQRVDCLVPVKCRKTVNADELIQSLEIDAVVVSTSASTHYTLVKQALLAGKHVFCEKPLTLDCLQDQELNELALQSKLKLVVGYTFLFNSSIIKLKELIDSDRMGQLYYLTATRTHMGLVREDVSVIWDLAPHDVSIMNYLLDAVPERVSAVAGKPLNLGMPDVAFISLFYPNGVLGQIHVSWVDSNKERNVRVIGSKARAAFDDLDGLEPIRLFEKGIGLDTQIQPDFGEFKFLLRDGDIISPKIEQHEPLRMILDNFVRVVFDDAKNLTDGIFASNVSSAIAAAHRSIENSGAPEEVGTE
jgi:predicted dehydrogenase